MPDEHAAPEAASHGPVRYIDFDGATFVELQRRMAAANVGDVLRIHAPFNEHCTIEVVDPDADDALRLKPLNEAHPCPPFCR